MDQKSLNFLKLIYAIKSQRDFNQQLKALLAKEGIQKSDFPILLEKELKSNPNAYPITSQEALRFLTYMPHQMFRKSPIFDKFLSILSKEDRRKLPTPSSIWGEQKLLATTAGLLDYPRKKLPNEVWLYEEEEPLPRLQPKLRSKIISEARYRLGKFGAKLIGAMLYGGAATYQYKVGADIDCSLYIDWKNFKGNEEILQEAFKNVEIPWGPYVLHLFVKPSTEQEQFEVADASYDVMKDEWILPPLILPKDFDPDVFFKPMIEIAEKKARQIDLQMGDVAREWTRLKKALRALDEGARDVFVIKEKIPLMKKVLLDKIDILCENFVQIWKDRKTLHNQLRQQYVTNKELGRYERFQVPEVTWKYLDEAGYVEFLKVLAKAHDAGVIKNLLEEAINKGETNDAHTQ